MKVHEEENTMETTPSQESRLNDLPAVSIRVTQKQLESIEQKYDLFSRHCDGSESILDCMAMGFDECSVIGALIDMNPEEFAGQYVVLSVD